MVACAYILRGTWRANSETGVSGLALIDKHRPNSYNQNILTEIAAADEESLDHIG